MRGFLLVFLGAGIGGALRHAVNLGCARACGTAFPYGTLAVNVVGSFVMGLLAGWLAFKTDGALRDWAYALRLFATTGILGGFTTFSAFSLDAVLLYERGEPALAGAYALGSVVLSILGLVAGLAIVRALA